MVSIPVGSISFCGTQHRMLANNPYIQMVFLSVFDMYLPVTVTETVYST